MLSQLELLLVLMFIF